MSLINNMLKDLERREAGMANITYMPYSRPKKNIASWSFYFKGLLIIGVLVLLFVMLRASLFHSHAVSRLAIPHEVKKTVALTQPNSTDDWKKIINISGITLQNKDNLTELTFLLDHDALYRLVSDEMQNQLIIYVDRSKLKSEIPALGYVNTAISKISAKQINDDTQFILSFAPGATLKYVNMNTVNGNPELIVAVLSPRPAAQQPTDTINQAIKSPAMQNILSIQYHTALINAESGHYDLAIDNLSALLKIDPEYKDARASLIALLIDQNKIPVAEQLIKDGLSRSPEFAPFVELKARIQAMLGNYKLALRTLQNNAPTLDDNPEYHAFIAAMYEQNKEYALASSLYRRLLAIDSNNSSWWFGFAVSLDKQNKQKSAVDAYKHAVAAGHLSAESLTYLQTRLHRLQESIDDNE